MSGLPIHTHNSDSEEALTGTIKYRAARQSPSLLRGHVRQRKERTIPTGKVEVTKAL